MGTSADKEITLKLSGDGRSLNATLRDGEGNLRTFKTATDDVSASVAQFTAQSNELEIVLSKRAKTLAEVTAQQEALSAAEKRGIIDSEEAAAASAALSKQKEKLIAQEERLALLQSASAGRIAAKYGGDIAALEKLAADEAKLTAAREAGMLTETRYAAALGEITKQRAALDGTASALEQVNLKTAFARQEFGRIGADALSGQFGRLEKSSITLAGHSGLLAAAFQFLVHPIGLVALAVVAALAVTIQAESEINKFNKALIATGNYAGTTAVQLRAQASEIGQSTGHYLDAQKALGELTLSGRLAGSALIDAGRGAVALADLTGQSVDKTVKDFEKLAKEPTKAAREYDDELHFLNASQLEQIANLERMGDKAGAAALGVKLLADAAVSRDAEVRKTLTGWAAFYDGISKAIGGATDKLANFILQHQQAAKMGVIANPISGGFGVAKAVYDYFSPPTQFDTVTGGGSTVSGAAAASAELARQERLADDVMKDVVMSINEETKALEKRSATVQKTELAKIYEKEDQEIRAMNLAVGQNTDLYLKNVQAIRDKYAPLEGEAKRIDALAAAHKNAGAEARALQKEENALAAILPKLQDIILRDAEDSDKAGAALAKYKDEQILIQKAIRDTIDLYQHHKISTAEYRAELALETQAQIASVDIYKKHAAAVEDDAAKQLRLHDVVGNYLRQLQDDTALAGLDDRTRAITKALDDQIERWGKLKDSEKALQEAAGHLNPTTQAGADAIRNATGASYDYTKAMDFMRQGMQSIEREVAGGFTGVFDAIGGLLTRNIKTFGDFWKAVIGGFKNMFAQIISQSLQMQFMGPIMGAFGFNATAYGGAGGGGFGGSSLAQTGASLLQSVGGGGASDIGTVGSANGGGLSSLLSSSTWLNAGKSLWSGFSSFWNGSSGYFMGPPTAAGATPGIGNVSGYGGSGIGQALGIAGGVYAGYNRYKSAGGGFAGLAGGAAYGLGTYALGAGLTSAVAGTGFAAGVSGAFAAVPVLGWVALAAMVIDKISGGKLFGTKYSPTGNVSSNISVGADGTRVSNQVEESKQSAFFGGKKWRWIDEAASQGQIDFATALDKTMLQVRQSASNALGGPLADAISASFKQVTDKSGKVTSQISTILGQTFSEPIEDFQKRLQADNVVAQIDAARNDHLASQVAASYASNAQTLLDASQFLLAAQVDIKHGQSLLGDDKSLVDINAVVGQLAQSNETLIQTYQRLQVETTTLQSTLDMMGVNLGKTGADFVKFADDAAQAAGGVDKLTALLQGFQAAYYSPKEIAQQQIAAYRKLADNALTGIGEATGESMADFRAHLEAVMPDLPPDKLVAWLQAGQYLAQATDAQEKYNAALAQEAQQKQALIASQQSAVLSYAQIVAEVEASIAEANQPSSAFQKSLTAISAAMNDDIDKLTAAAKAAAMLGAREEDLAKVRELAGIQAGVLAKELFASSKDVVAELFGTGQNSLGAQAQSTGQYLTQFADGITAVGDAVQKFRDSMLIDNSLSPLNAQDQLNEALTQLRQTGDENTARRALEIARGLTASGDDYKKLFDQITGLVRPQPTNNAGGGSGGYSGTSAATGTQLSDSQRLADAKQLAQNVADLFGFDKSIGKDETFDSIAKELGFNMDQLGQALGLNNDELSKYITSLESRGGYDLNTLSKQLHDETTRIVDAINGSNLFGGTVQHSKGGKVVTIDAANDDASVSPPANVVPFRPAPPLPIRPPGSSPDAPVSEQTGRDIRDHLIKQNGLIEQLARTVSSAGVSTEGAVVALGPKLDEIRGELRAGNSGQRSVRTPDYVVRR